MQSNKSPLKQQPPPTPLPTMAKVIPIMSARHPKFPKPVFQVPPPYTTRKMRIARRLAALFVAVSLTALTWWMLTGKH